MTRGDSAADAEGERSIAHRLRNVLHGAKLQLALLEHELRGSTVTPEAREAMAAVRNHIDHMAKLVSELPADSSEGGSP